MFNYLDDPDSKTILWSPDDCKKEYQVQNNRKTNSKNIQIFLYLVVPLSTTLAIILASELFNQALESRINKLESTHQRYKELQMEIKSKNNELVEINESISNYSVLFTHSANPYPFTFFLQEITPANVSINYYLMDKEKFKICAYGGNYEGLEDYIDLIKEIPNIDEKSVTFEELSSVQSNESNMSNCTSNNANDKPIISSIKGNFTSLDLYQIENLYQQSNDFEQHQKIKLYVRHLNQSQMP